MSARCIRLRYWLGKALIAITFLFSARTVFSQQLQWAPVIKDDFQHSSIEFIGSFGDSIYASMTDPGFSMPEILVLSADSLRICNRFRLPAMPEENGKFRSDALVLAGDRIVWIGSKPARENGFREAVSSSFTLRGLPGDIPVPLGILPESNQRNQPYLLTYVSPSGDAVLLVQEVEERDNSRPAIYWCAVVNQAGLLWSKSIELPYSREIAALGDWLVANDGNLAMLSGAGSTKNLQQPSRVELSNKRYFVFTYRYQENKLKEFDVSLRDKWLMDLAIAQSPKGEIYVAGYYSADPYFSVAGVFLLVIDPLTGEVKEKGMSPIDKQIVRAFPQDDSGLGREIASLYLDHFHVDEDGSAILCGEQYYVREYWLTEPSTGRQIINYVYHHNDILLMRLTRKGTQEWSKRIPKRQSSSNDGGPYSSYTYHFSGGTSWLLFNDHPSNNNNINQGVSDEPESYTGNKQSSFVAVKANAGGDIARVVLEARADKKPFFRPSKAWVAGKSLVLYPELDRKTLKLAMVRF